MAKAQRTDPELQTLLSNPETYSIQLTELTLYTGNLTLFCDTSTGILRPLILSQLPYGKSYLTLFTLCHTPVYVLPDTSSPPNMSGPR